MKKVQRTKVTVNIETSLVKKINKMAKSHKATKQSIINVLITNGLNV